MLAGPASLSSKDLAQVKTLPRGKARRLRRMPRQQTQGERRAIALAPDSRWPRSAASGKAWRLPEACRFSRAAPVRCQDLRALPPAVQTFLDQFSIFLCEMQRVESN